VLTVDIRAVESIIKPILNWIMEVSLGSFRNASGYGAGLIGMGKTGGRNGQELAGHALRASARRAAIAAIKSDTKSANFKRRASGVGSIDTNLPSNEGHAKNIDDNLKAAQAKKLGISVSELERRLAALRRHRMG